MAKSAAGGGQLGLGPGGGASFAKSEILALSAVFAPLLAILLIPIMAIQTLRVRLSRRSREEA